MKQYLTLTAIVFSALSLVAQEKVFTRTGSVSFSSDTPMEKIEATHNKTTCALDLSTGKVQVAILVKGFSFEKALMEEHFNENYMESSKFPKATFKGAIDDFDAAKFKGGDAFAASVTGDLLIHGVTVKRTLEIEFKNVGGSIMVRANFVVKPEDHDIKIPGVVAENIAKEINVKLSAKMEKAK